MERENRIIQQSLHLFLTTGIKGVSMDDVAQHLGISKKTLYLHVKNKEDLVEKSFAYHHNCMKEVIEGLSQKYENAIDEIFEIDERICEMMKHNHPFLLSNLKKYYPKVWSFMDDLKKKSIFKTIKNNLERGISQGLYRPLIDTDIITKFMLNRVDSLVNEELFPLTEYDFRQLLQENRIYHIRGIATKKGIEYLDKKMTNE